MNFLDKNKKWISTLLVWLLIFLRCGFGVVSSYGKILNIVICGIAFLYVCYLSYKNLDEAKKSIFNPAIAWLVFFTGLVFIYGHFGLFMQTGVYSTQYALLTIIPAFIVYEILWHNKKNIIEILGISGSFVILTIFITNFVYDELWDYALTLGHWYRIGKVPGGTAVDTCTLYLLMMIPMAYDILISHRFKRYIIPVAIGIFGILIGGSRAAALPVLLVIAIMLFGSASDNKTRVRYLIVLGLMAVVGLALIMFNPVLYNLLGSRIVELFVQTNTTDFDLHTSTGQRMAVMAAFKEHFWESPIFGHGFYAFKSMPYSALEEWHPSEGVTEYRNIQIHMNFLELLFGMGILGFVSYYWFPLKEVIDTIKTKNKQAKLLGLSFLLSMFFIDLGLDMYYKYMTPYYVYLLVYVLLNVNEEEK
ncbi:MAG: O-antigen ligase family protein [Pseudobutyrivibrio sp.]|nr:O-antigen ligase family protein [Pseudobutyrivibrio sp.]